jgi:hypothetical protein
MNSSRQKGTTTVEFAIVAAALFIMIFGVFEVARAYFVYSVLEEVTRRGSRLAAVCPVGDPAVPQLAVFNASGSTGQSRLVRGLNPSNVVIDYLDANGAVIALPSETANFLQIRFVRARVVGYQHRINVPFVAGISIVNMPEFVSVLPRESLGVPREGAVTPC